MSYIDQELKTHYWTLVKHAQLVTQHYSDPCAFASGIIDSPHP